MTIVIMLDILHANSALSRILKRHIMDCAKLTSINILVQKGQLDASTVSIPEVLNYELGALPLSVAFAEDIACYSLFKIYELIIYKVSIRLRRDVIFNKVFNHNFTGNSAVLAIMSAITGTSRENSL